MNVFCLGPPGPMRGGMGMSRGGGGYRGNMGGGFRGNSGPMFRGSGRPMGPQSSNNIPRK